MATDNDESVKTSYTNVDGDSLGHVVVKASGSHEADGGGVVSVGCTEETPDETDVSTVDGVWPTASLDCDSDVDSVFTLLPSSRLVAYYYSAYCKIWI